jgi:hypothetical protein
VELHFLPVLQTHGCDRRILADAAHDSIAAVVSRRRGLRPTAQNHAARREPYEAANRTMTA